MTRLIRFVSCILCFALIAFSLVACKAPNDPSAVTDFLSLDIDREGNATAVVSVALEEVQKRPGEHLLLYEVLPGETLESACSKDPLATCGIGTEARFYFSLAEKESRLYSSFVVMFEDGTLLDRARSFADADALSMGARSFLWNSSPKGIVVSDTKWLSALHCVHTMVEIRLSSLLSASDAQYTFDGVEYTLSKDALQALDARVKAGCDLGMQVSLRIAVDCELLAIEQTGLIHFLCSRYATQEYGCVSALFLEVSNTYPVAEVARLMRVCHLALRSHVSDGRVYVIPPSSSAKSVRSYFAEIGTEIAQGDPFSWGAAVLPVWNDEAIDDELTYEDLQNFRSGLREIDGGYCNYFALCDMRVPATDEDKQAALYAYAYAKGVFSGADLMFSVAMEDTVCGMLDDSGNLRKIAQMFSSVDGTLSADLRLLCKRLPTDMWNEIDRLPLARRQISGVANSGAASGAEQTVFDFAQGGTCGFVAIGGRSLPEIKHSEAFGKSVLFTWLNPEAPVCGVAKTLLDPEILSGMSAITVSALTQCRDTDRYQLKLTMQGTDHNGKLLCYEAEAGQPVGSWSTVSFYIAPFTAEADLTLPCVVTLSVEMGEEADESFAFWLKDVRAFQPQSASMDLSLLLTALICFVLTLVLLLWGYHHWQLKKQEKIPTDSRKEIGE